MCQDQRTATGAGLKAGENIPLDPFWDSPPPHAWKMVPCAFLALFSQINSMSCFENGHFPMVLYCLSPWSFRRVEKATKPQIRLNASKTETLITEIGLKSGKNVCNMHGKSQKDKWQRMFTGPPTYDTFSPVAPPMATLPQSPSKGWSEPTTPTPLVRASQAGFGGCHVPPHPKFWTMGLRLICAWANKEEISSTSEGHSGGHPGSQASVRPFKHRNHRTNMSVWTSMT